MINMPTAKFWNLVAVKMLHKDLFRKFQLWEMLLDKQLSFINKLQTKKEMERKPVH